MKKTDLAEFAAEGRNPLKRGKESNDGFTEEEVAQINMRRNPLKRGKESNRSGRLRSGHHLRRVAIP